MDASVTDNALPCSVVPGGGALKLKSLAGLTVNAMFTVWVAEPFPAVTRTLLVPVGVADVVGMFTEEEVPTAAVAGVNIVPGTLDVKVTGPGDPLVTAVVRVEVAGSP